MKISSVPSEEGFENFKPEYHKVFVWLNGEEVNEVFFADEEAGVVKKYVEPLTVVGDEIVSETLYGNVKIIEEIL